MSRFLDVICTSGVCEALCSSAPGFAWHLPGFMNKTSFGKLNRGTWCVSGALEQDVIRE